MASTLPTELFSAPGAPSCMSPGWFLTLPWFSVCPFPGSVYTDLWFKFILMLRILPKLSLVPSLTALPLCYISLPSPVGLSLSMPSLSPVLPDLPLTLFLGPSVYTVFLMASCLITPSSLCTCCRSLQKCPPLLSVCSHIEGRSEQMFLHPS